MMGCRENDDEIDIAFALFGLDILYAGPARRPPRSLRPPCVPTSTASGCAMRGPGGGAAAGGFSFRGGGGLLAIWSAVSVSTAPSVGFRDDLSASFQVDPWLIDSPPDLSTSSKPFCATGLTQRQMPRNTSPRPPPCCWYQYESIEFRDVSGAGAASLTEGRLVKLHSRIHQII